MPSDRHRLFSAFAATLARVLACALALSGCAEGGVRLPRLRVRGWLTVSGSGERGVSAGGEVGLVMPLDVGAARAGRDEAEEPAGTSVLAALDGRAAPCRVPLACRWESVERARALARSDEDEDGGAP